jgi:uncharacterized membrane protein YgdD (TMEM256/DUF423 family)
MMSRQGRYFFTGGCIAALLAVMLGAFGAHVLKARVEPALLATYQTAVEYHFYHALGLLGAGLASAHCLRPGMLRLAGWLMAAGLLLFSGSLYLLVLTGVRGLGAITPLGGLAWMAAWLLLALAFLPQRDESRPGAPPAG